MSINLKTEIELQSNTNYKSDINHLVNIFKQNKLRRAVSKQERKINNYWLLYSSDPEFRTEVAKILNLKNLKIEFNIFKNKILNNLDSIEKCYSERKIYF